MLQVLAKDIMKQIEHALKRVHVADADGEFKELSARMYSVATAIAERTVDADRGCQLSLSEIEKDTKKRRSTVKTGLRELVESGVLHRSKPSPGPWETHIFRFNQAILDAAEKSRPYLGAPIFIAKNATQINDVKHPPLNANICDSKHATARIKPQYSTTSDGQLLAGQELTGNCNDLHSPPLPAPREIKSEPCSPRLPAPAGALCINSSKDALKGDSKRFFEFLKFFNFSIFDTFCMRRKKDGRRGGFFLRQEINSYEGLKRRVDWAAGQNLELVMKRAGLLLVDDVKPFMFDSAKKSGLAFAAIETSGGNFQLLFAGGQN